MNTYILNIELQSDTLVGSAGGHGSLIDSEVVFDEYGIPYIPGKRIKGLLRDSLMEVVEILSNSNNGKLSINDIDIIFGKPGNERFSNFYIDEDFHLTDYENLIAEMAKSTLRPETVKSYFATEVSQTAMDEETGAAKEGSLRRVRVLKELLPGETKLRFRARIRFPQQFEKHMVLACKNLTRMGTIRNRGLGNVKASLHNGADEPLTSQTSRQLINNLTASLSSQNNTENESKDPVSKFSENTDKTHYLELTLQNIQKLLIRANGSDENMVNSLNYIQGSNIMGLVAQKYLEKYKPDENFFKLFLRGYLHFSPALPANSFNGSHTLPFPLMANVENGILKFDPDKNYKGKIEYLTIANDNKVRPIHCKTQLSLHHERNKKTGMVDPGSAVYNYQAISPYQQFRTRIFGSEENLKIIKGLITNNELVKIGASQTAEYGSCKISVSEIKKFDAQAFIGASNQTSQKFILCLVSDTIIYNAYGYPSLNMEDVKSYLGLQNGDGIKPSKVRPVRIENYIKVWKSKKTSDTAFRAGTCFELDKLPENYMQLLTKGLGERTNEGYGKVFFFYKDTDLQIAKDKQTRNSNAESDTYKNLVSWVRDKELEKDIELLAMEYAEGFADKNMGNLARQLLQPMTQNKKLTGENGSIKDLSPTVKDKLENFDNDKGKSLEAFFKDTDRNFENPVNDDSFLKNVGSKISSLSDEERRAMKKHFIRTFLTYLNLANKSKAS